MPIVYNKFFELLKQQNKTMYDIRKNKILGTATLEKMRKSEGHIDTRSIESLCEFLNCQPGDLMEYVPLNHNKIQSKPDPRFEMVMGEDGLILSGTEEK